MKLKLNLVVMGLLTVALLVGAGCAKTNTTSTPAGVQVKVDDNSDWESSAAGKQEAEKAALVAQAAAESRAKAAAMNELTSVVIHFDFDSYELDEEARATLALKADLMRRYGAVRVVIEGHCDERGTEEYNLALGERRARAAYEHLVILGVNPERMSIVSFGEERPIDPAHNETAWAKNRRAEFVVQ